MKYLVVILLFVTAWVLLVALMRYLTQRPPGTRVWPSSPSGRKAACCLEVPCSAECAWRHQSIYTIGAVDGASAPGQIGEMIKAGRELEPQPVLPQDSR